MYLFIYFTYICYIYICSGDSLHGYIHILFIYLFIYSYFYSFIHLYCY